MSSIDDGSSSVSGSLILIIDDGKNSDFRNMSLNKDSIAPGVRDSISVLVGFRDDIFGCL